MTAYEQRFKRWLPSPTGVGIGMLVPGIYVVTMFLGGVADYLWRKLRPKSAEAQLVPLASGLIAGEALIVMVLALLLGLGLMSQPE